MPEKLDGLSMPAREERANALIRRNPGRKIVVAGLASGQPPDLEHSGCAFRTSEIHRQVAADARQHA
jgi:hypothetical protein